MANSSSGPTRRTVLGGALATAGLAGSGLLARPDGIAAATLDTHPMTASLGGAMILVHIPNIGAAPLPIPGYEKGDWFVADSFSFGIEREMKKSGEKGGTADINIGVGELQECTISKSLDTASSTLAQLAVNGNALSGAQIDFLQGSGDSRPVAYLRYKLDRCFVKSWSTSGDADDRPTEEVAFYYNKIAFIPADTDRVFNWDRTKQTPWPDHGLSPLGV